MLRNTTEAELDALFTLMEDSFPANERRPRLEQRALLNNPLYQLLTLSDTTPQKALALMAVWELEDIMYIEHFAVHPDLRGAGTGSQMLTNLSQQTTKMICLEVEPPNTQMALRRIGFYRRNGFFLNEYPYLQPPMSKGQDTVGLMLMTSGKAVDAQEFKHIKSLIHRHVYGQLVN